MSSISRPAVIVTGISENLGQRLLPHLQDFQVVGVDTKPPDSGQLSRFERMDLGREDACDSMVQLLKKSEARAVVHLAFLTDPSGSGASDVDRMWQINVAGTARVMEAIAEVNRHGGLIDTFIFPSSVTAYGSDTPGPVREENPLGAHTFPYAIHKQEADDVVRYRAANLGACTAYVLRPHVFAGAPVQNYMINTLRGTAYGEGSWGQKLQRDRKRLPIVMPFGERYVHKRFQFVHVDDMARLIAYILQRPVAKNNLVVLNVAGRGDALTYQTCVRISDQKIVRLPGRGMCRLALTLMRKLKISAIPPQALPYMIGSHIMNTNKLKTFLGAHYEEVIQFTIEDALKDCFSTEHSKAATVARV